MLISANDITQWALTQNRKAQDTLPEVVRRLILESDPDATKVDIPSGDSVALAGFDGVVISKNGFYPEQLLPEGESIWEIGCNKSVSTKVNSDFEKRAKVRLLKQKKEKTYVAVSPHPWTKKDAWIKEKRKRRIWKNIHALNAEDLSQWLERCPKTRDWLASTVFGHSLADLAAEALPILVLTGGWDTLYQADKLLIETISGRPHEAVEAGLQRLSTSQEMIGSSLFQKEGSRWKVLTPELAWDMSEPCITEGMFNRFFSEAEKVFSEVPNDYIAPSERTKFPIHHVGEGYSSLLKNGLTEALARIATTHNRQAPGYSGRSPQGKVELCLREVFKAQRRYNPAFWVSISPYLPTLAEAWDSGLLDCLEDVLQNKPEALEQLFQSPQYTLSSSEHSNLLFALQALAWNPIYLSRVADLLLRLRQFDIAKNNSWGPISAFQELFVGFTANTAATLEERKQILTRILNTTPGEGWPLLIVSIPTENTLIISRTEPRFRKLDEAISRTPDHKEYAAYVEALWELAIQFAGNSTDKWIELLENISELTQHWLFEKFISTLDEQIPHLSNNKEKLWEKLVIFLAHHKRFPSAAWSLNPTEICQLEALTRKLQPLDLRQIYRLLFIHNAMDLYDVPFQDGNDDFDEMDRSILEKRKAALLHLLTELTANDFVTYASSIIDSESMAVYAFSTALTAIFNVDETKYTQLLVFLYKQQDMQLQRLAASILANLVRINPNKYDLQWADNLTIELSDDGKASVWSVFPPREAIWKKVHLAGGAVENLYWQKLCPTPADCETGGEILASKLLEHQQPVQAIECLGWLLYHKQKPVPELLLDALSLFITSPHEQETEQLQIRAYTVERLVHYLETESNLSNNQHEQLAHLEWLIFPLLKQHFGKYDLSLFINLAKDPSLFVEILSIMYHPSDNSEPTEPNDQQRALGKRAFEVLKAWNKLPGEHNSDINSAFLIGWYEKGLELAEESKIDDIFKSEFGQKLGKHPLVGKDGHWPHEAIRVLIEQTGAEDLMKALKRGKRNSLFGRMREVQQARLDDTKRAAQFRISARAVASAYPKTASLLLNLANEFEEHWINRAL